MKNPKDSEFAQKLKQERQMEKGKLKALSFSGKLDYIWTYYKVPLILIVAITALIISTIVHILNPDPANVMNAMLINSDFSAADSQPAELFTPFLKDLGFDTETCAVSVNNGFNLDPSNENSINPQTWSALCTQFMAGAVDTLLADEDSFLFIAEKGYVKPVSLYLSEEELSRYEDALVYGQDPESGKKAVLGIRLCRSTQIKDSGLFFETPVIGLSYTAPNEATAVDYVRYILEH